MTKSMTSLFLALLASLSFVSPVSAEGFNPDASLVEIEVTRKVYDYRTPWNVRSDQIRKNGVVIGDGTILTTADGLSGQYLCRVQKGGISKQYTASVEWVDYYSNLALVQVAAPDFWTGMKAVPLVEELPQSGDLEVYRWRSGRIEQRAAEIIRLYVGQSKTSYIEHLHLSASSEIDSAGWAEIVIKNDRLVGLTSSATKARLNILPAPFIDYALARKTSEAGLGSGYFDFDWMAAKNPALVNSKGFTRRDIGIVVTGTGKKRLAEASIQTGDIVFEVDGFTIDNEGKYLDPNYGRLSVYGLATRKNYTDELISMKVWRDGKEQSVGYALPEVDFEKSLIPERRYDQAPRYLIAGGLVFQPLDGPFLRALGKHTPILLDYYREATDIEREGIVLLSMILPDDYNQGYENLRFLIVDEINSKQIVSLEDVAEALEDSNDGFHRILFTKDSTIQHVVLDANLMDQATERILAHYRISSAESL